jgi:hypothetical protein
MGTTTNERGAQRLSLEQLQEWEALKYGMFIHYGMSTYSGSELPDGSHPSTLYELEAPTVKDTRVALSPMIKPLFVPAQP